MLLGTLVASLFTGRGMYRAGNQGQGIKKKSLTPFHSLTNFEIIDYFKGVKGFNGVFSRNNFKKGVSVINLDHSKNTGTHWVVIFVKSNEVIYFDSFGAEYIPKEIMKKIEHSFLENKNIKTSIFRIQNYNSIMCGYFCILFIECMLNDKTLTDFTNLFSPWNFEKNDDIIKRYFQFFYKKMMETINLEFKELIEDQSNYRLSEISQIKNYFSEEIQYQQSLTNKLSKYLTVFDYSNKVLTVVLINNFDK